VVASSELANIPRITTIPKTMKSLRAIAPERQTILPVERGRVYVE